jgi:hypothetical protein
MAKINQGPVVNGVMTIEFQNWKFFNKFITQRLLRYPGYAFRGQADSDWLLQTTIDRLRNNNPNIKVDYNRNLEAFKYAARGRRNGHVVSLNENEWWSLGQHYGLATPLLDFTRSPFVALYFAFLEENEKYNRAVYALHMHSVQMKNRDLLKDDSGLASLDIFTPLTDENSRLINQAGLFVRLPPNTNLEQWVTINFPGKDDLAVLVKMIIPNRMREDCLIYLNKSNINHLTLFPDLHGASQFVNLQASIINYDSLGYI